MMHSSTAMLNNCSTRVGYASIVLSTEGAAFNGGGEGGCNCKKQGHASQVA